MDCIVLKADCCKDSNVIEVSAAFSENRRAFIEMPVVSCFLLKVPNAQDI